MDKEIKSFREIIEENEKRNNMTEEDYRLVLNIESNAKLTTFFSTASIIVVFIIGFFSSGLAAMQILEDNPLFIPTMIIIGTGIIGTSILFLYIFKKLKKPIGNINDDVEKFFDWKLKRKKKKQKKK